jgi:hypothetical protein
MDDQQLLAASNFMDLDVPCYAYMHGFLQADGHLRQGRGNKGALTVEIQADDATILTQFALLVPYYSTVSERQRTTNFSVDYRSACWSVYDRSFRETLISIGFPIGRKSQEIVPPTRSFARVDYFRGWLDADGSLGLTSQGLPFLSLTTASYALMEAYVQFIREMTGKQKKPTRNTRDNIFNVTVYKEDARTLAGILYYDDCLALPRKQAQA